MNEMPFVELTLSDPTTGKMIRTMALVDTGASRTCIPKPLAEYLDLKICGEEEFVTPGGYLRCPTYVVDIQIRDRWIRGHLVNGMPDGVDTFLLGWDILKGAWTEPLRMLVEGRTITEVINILDFLPSFKEKHVLILGQDTTEIQRLRTIQERLKFNGYKGILVKDVTDIEIQSVEEKMNMLGSLCAFVVCENSQASGHIDELKICCLNRFVTAILQQEGHGATWMQADYSFDYSFIETFTYPNVNEICSAVDKAVEWARKKIYKRKEFFNGLYRWRSIQQD